MNALEECSRPLWLDDAPDIAAAPYVGGDGEADAIVIGAGMAGLSVAYELCRRGKSVVVLDRGAPARGMTARTTAHLASELDDFYCELIGRRGLDDARMFAASQNAAIARIETVVREEGIDCDFARVDGYLIANTHDRIGDLEEEYEAAREAGMQVEWADRAPISGIDTGSCLRFAGQGRFHPLKYLAGLAHAISARGGRIYANAPAVGVDEDEDVVRVTLASGEILRAAHVVVAANTPFNDRVAIHTKQAPYRTYAMAFDAPAGAVADVLIWDDLDPYHYVRIQPAGDRQRVLIGGEDHKTGLADDAEARFADLEIWSRLRFPELGAVTHRWSGQVYEPIDFLPFIGRNPGDERVFAVTGDSGQGITMGATAALLIPDLIEARDNAWTETFRPKRKPLGGALDYLNENKDVVANLSEYVRAKTKASADEIGPGEGALLRAGLKLLAAYRDEAGALHVHSATCTHIGCVVHWNSFERCWDCPCHGSQFSVEGEVLQGPAFRPLAEAGEDRTRREEPAQPEA